MNDKVERSGPGSFQTHCVLLPRFSLSFDAATSASSSLVRLAIAKVQSGHPPCMLRWRPSSLETTRDNALLRVSQLFGNCGASIIMAPSLAHLIPRSKAMISTIEMMIILPGRPQAFGFGPRNLGCCTDSNGCSLSVFYSSSEIFIGFGAAASTTTGACRSSSRLKRFSFSKSGPTTLIPTTFYRVSAAVRIGVDRYTCMHEHSRLDIPCRSPRE
jgi:hypothetical protein